MNEENILKNVPDEKLGVLSEVSGMISKERLKEIKKNNKPTKLEKIILESLKDY